MLLKILKFPDKRLKIKATAVKNIDSDIKKLVKDMFATMYQEYGVGLAATQVDRHIRIFVSDTSDEKNNPLCFINPQIISKTGEKINEEGCLSVPDFRADVKRAKTVIVKALDENGKEFELRADDELLTICIQHEIDHLDGILFIDYLSKLKQRRLLDKIKQGKI